VDGEDERICLSLPVTPDILSKSLKRVFYVSSPLVDC